MFVCVCSVLCGGIYKSIWVGGVVSTVRPQVSAPLISRPVVNYGKGGTTPYDMESGLVGYVIVNMFCCGLETYVLYI